MTCLYVRGWISNTKNYTKNVESQQKKVQKLAARTIHRVAFRVEFLGDERGLAWQFQRIERNRTEAHGFNGAVRAKDTGERLCECEYVRCACVIRVGNVEVEWDRDEIEESEDGVTKS